MWRIVEVKQGARIMFVGAKDYLYLPCFKSRFKLIDGSGKGVPYSVPIGFRDIGKARAFRFEQLGQLLPRELNTD